MHIKFGFTNVHINVDDKTIVSIDDLHYDAEYTPAEVTEVVTGILSIIKATTEQAAK